METVVLWLRDNNALLLDTYLGEGCRYTPSSYVYIRAAQSRCPKEQ